MIEIKAVPLDKINTFRMTVIERTEILGSVDVYLQDGRAYLTNLVSGELHATLLFGLGKAALNMADLRGAKEAVCDDASMEVFLSPLRFEKISDTRWCVSLEDYFKTGCHA